MARTASKIAGDIRTLRVQGARRVAQAALEGLVSAAKTSRAKTNGALYADLLKVARMLTSTRPTEPMMRNALDDSLRFGLAWIRTHQKEDAGEMVRALSKHKTHLLQEMEEAADKISKLGAAEIPKNASVLIHCHSTTVVRVLIQAQKMGKRPHVVCLETRPLYQGRLSARELAAAGVDVSLAVDSAAGSLLDKIDLVLVGADAMTGRGDLINKVGTFSLAQLARLHGVRFLCAAELYKYDPLTRFGRSEAIEQRAAGEVWGSGYYRQEKRGKNKALRIPQHLKILNPAFDRTPAKYVSGYITEEGLMQPAYLVRVAEKKLGAGGSMASRKPAQ